MADSLKTTLTQLVRSGPQEDYFTKPAQATLYGSDIIKVPNHGEHTARIEFSDVCDFGKFSTCTMAAHGDLISSVSLYVRMPPLQVPVGSTYAGFTQSIGYALIDYIEVLIGGTVIQRLEGRWMEAMNYYTNSASDIMVGTSDTHRVLPYNAIAPRDLYIPIPFWFAKKSKYALPIFLFNQYTVQIRVKMRNFEDVVTYDGNTPPTEMPLLQASIIADYVFITDQEKAQLLAKPKHEFIIEQWNANNSVSVTANAHTIPCHIDVNNVVKEIFWVLIEEASQENNDWFNYSLRQTGLQGSALMTQASLLLDNAVRVSKLPESFFRMVTKYKYHNHGAEASRSDRNIYSMSFAVAPELLQPSGMLDASRYDQLTLHLDLAPSVPQAMVYILVVTYNVLVMEDGALTLRFV